MALDAEKLIECAKTHTKFYVFLYAKSHKDSTRKENQSVMFVLSANQSRHCHVENKIS